MRKSVFLLIVVAVLCFLGAALAYSHPDDYDRSPADLAVRGGHVVAWTPKPFGAWVLMYDPGRCGGECFLVEVDYRSIVKYNGRLGEIESIDPYFEGPPSAWQPSATWDRAVIQGWEHPTVENAMLARLVFVNRTESR